MAIRYGEPGVIEPGRYACPVCDQRFIELAEKKAHIRLLHKEK